jgi:hypothetical protein
MLHVYMMYSMCTSLSKQYIIKIPWDGCKAKQIASAPGAKDCVNCAHVCLPDIFSVFISLGTEIAWHYLIDTVKK